MKIEKVTGCTNNDIYVDGVSLDDLPDEKLVEVRDRMLADLKKLELTDAISDMIEIMAMPYETSSDADCCETCGDCVVTRTLEV